MWYSHPYLNPYLPLLVLSQLKERAGGLWFCAGLARKEDFAYITYYCPHCNALNQSKRPQEEHASGSVSRADAVDNSAGPMTDDIRRTSSSSPERRAAAIESEHASGSNSPGAGGGAVTSSMPIRVGSELVTETAD